MAEIEEIVREYRDIKEDYAYDASIFCEDDEGIIKLKEIINTKLCQVDKTIILLYADCMSYMKLGKTLGVSHMIARREVLRIRDIIMTYYNETNDN